MTDNTSAKKEKGSFFKNLKLEFKKIIWPDTKDVAKKTLLIIVVTIILGVLIKLLDTGIQALLSLIA
ncbi:MAG: preprotein translocase subunit SecE [Lachnospiraceae bacterium]|jgi:preprotein translocase subunit SecE|nr:preprotein translocase subunit SecE [Lachnospiraceae bacterium]MBR2842257.1 preprotein translocase subunit SecE [Lachnospiraceae bacterium]MBR3261792.1 preprotein translocase subunit SecE [Lachnospiraceae bacterium]MBR6356549.1 preprotein translocase subunit SecE [Lachnospiraceae bacterium]MDO4206412.1 preprotein translocase subunit SecE [Lachnospiraceae bacterium]